MEVPPLTPSVNEMAKRAVDGMVTGGRHAYKMRDRRFREGKDSDR